MWSGIWENSWVDNQRKKKKISKSFHYKYLNSNVCIFIRFNLNHNIIINENKEIIGIKNKVRFNSTAIQI